MAGRSEQEAGDVVAAYDFGRFRRLEADGVADRCQPVAGDFFVPTASPAGLSVVEATPAPPD
jgi:hypothetical protein